MRALIGLLAFLLAASFSSVVAAPRPELLPAAELARSNRDSIKVWVFFRDKGSSVSEAVDQRAALRIARKGSPLASVEAEWPVSSIYLKEIERLGGRVWQTSRWLNAASVWISPQKLEAVEQLPFVSGFRPVARFVRGPDPEPAEPAELLFQKPTGVAYADSYGPTITQLDTLNIPIVHTLGYRGDSVLVAMLDDGFRKIHTVFSALYTNGQVLAEYDFIQKDGDTAPDSVENLQGQGNHGTETWSAVGGTVPGSFLGGAFKAQFILAKTEYIPAENQAEEDNWVAGLEWADSIGADVISSSLGYYDFDDSCMCDYVYSDLDGVTAITSAAASMAADLGILVCNAAGNEAQIRGDTSLIAPADAFDILACGAVDSFGVLTVFSSKGLTADGRIKPELLAQGSRVYLASPINMSGFTRASGTSFSTPLTASASAVLMSVHPDWAPRQIREALMLTASNAGSPNIQRGWGIPDVYKAAQFRPDSTVTLEVLPFGNAAVGSSPYSVRVVIHNPRVLPVAAPKVWYKEITGSSFSSVPLTAHLADTFKADVPIGSGNREIVFYAEANASVVKDPVFAPRWVYRLLVSPARFADSVELGPASWKATGTSTDWGPSGRAAFTGNFSFSDSPRGNYKNNSDGRWEMKNGVSLDPIASYFLSYYERLAFLSGDSGWVEASTDGGQNWSLVGIKRGGTQASWTEQVVSLGSFSGTADFRLRFRSQTNTSGVADGWDVDHIFLHARGDLNGDGELSPSDIVLLLLHVYAGDPLVGLPAAAADVNGDLLPNPPDVVCLLLSVYAGAGCVVL